MKTATIPHRTADTTGLFGLAIDTSRRGGSIAWGAAADISTHILDLDMPAAVGVAPLLDQILNQQSVAPRLQFIAAATGPGSFTGLRTAVTTAKTLAYALQIPVIAVNSLAAVAAAFFQHADHARVIVVAKAYRGQSYLGKFSRDEISAGTTVMMDDDALLAQLSSPPPAAVLSDHRKVLTEIPNAIPMDAPERVAAAGVLRLAASSFDRGETIDAMRLEPNYFRPSAAEEQLG